MIASNVLLALLLRMMVVAAIVVIAAMVAERSRPTLAALVATLPISIGPTYVLLALDHDAAFLSDTALKSVASIAATQAFITAYANTATRFSPWPAIGLAYLAWLPFALITHLVDWSIAGACLFVAVVAVFSHYAMRAYRDAPPGPRARTRWWDIPVRASAVAVLVAFVTGLSHVLGTSGVGTLTNFPIVMSSVSLITHFRLGGLRAAAMLSNTVGGMVGVAAALLFLHLAVKPLGVTPALCLGLAICLIWNFGLYLFGQARMRRRQATSL